MQACFDASHHRVQVYCVERIPAGLDCITPTPNQSLMRTPMGALRQFNGSGSASHISALACLVSSVPHEQSAINAVARLRIHFTPLVMLALRLFRSRVWELPVAGWQVTGLTDGACVPHCEHRLFRVRHPGFVRTHADFLAGDFAVMDYLMRPCVFGSVPLCPRFVFR